MKKRFAVYLLVLSLMIVALTGCGTSACEQVATKFTDSYFSANGEKIYNLYSKKFAEYYYYDRNSAIESIGERCQDSIENLDYWLDEGWNYTISGINVYEYSESELEEFNSKYDVEGLEGEKASGYAEINVEVDIKSKDKKDSENADIKLSVYKINNTWYLLSYEYESF